METKPTTSRSLENYYHINGDSLEKQYKELLSGYRTWSELSHADEWLISPENIGESICIEKPLSVMENFIQSLPTEPLEEVKGALSQ